MSRFDDELRTSLPSMFDAFGSEVLIKGIKVPAIFEQDTFPTDAGYITSETLMVEKENTKWFEKGDQVFVDGTLFKVKRIDADDEVLTLVELYRA